jgi:uncharacterized membrane protein YqjE
MLSSDKNVENIAQFVETAKNYVESQKEYLKLDVTEKFVRLTTALSLSVVILILAVAMLFYLSFAIVYWIEPLTGIACAFFLVAMFFLALLIVVYTFRKPWLERPLVRFLAKTLFN